MDFVENGTFYLILKRIKKFGPDEKCSLLSTKKNAGVDVDCQHGPNRKSAVLNFVKLKTNYFSNF